METEPISELKPEVKTVRKEELYQKYILKDLEPKSGQEVRVLVNMIETLDGVTTIPQDEGKKASEQGMGHPVDQNLMRYLRFHADATLNGSSTLRISGSDSTIDETKYTKLIKKRRELGKADNPYACVLTSRADPQDFDEQTLNGAFFKDRGFHSILFAGEDAPSENTNRIEKAVPEGKKFDVVRIPLTNGRPSVKALVKILHDNYGVKTLLSEGGSSLNGSLVNEGLVTDIFLTISPRIAVASPDSKGIITGKETRRRSELIKLTLVSSFYEPSSQMQFLHYEVAR